MRVTIAFLSLLSSLASAGPAPAIPGMQLLWSDAFDGSPGQTPNQNNWNIITDVRYNNELQTYTRSNANLQLSGGSTVQLVPRRDARTGGWTSARIESRYAFTPQPGRLTAVQASIRFGDHPRHARQGMWPAFWLLGDSYRRGTLWPVCGEIDVMETINGEPRAHGTMHCGREVGAHGGPCNEPVGRGGSVDLPDSGWHTWTVQIDRRNSGWRDETVRWLKDGREFFAIRGEDIGDEGVWATLTHSPLFIILNVAVGGDWPGYPNEATLDGYGNMMEVDYVAVYQG